MRYSVQTRDYLILRDGKPFGDEKNFGGTAYNTIMPQTLAGMVRTAVGFSRNAKYFSTEENIRNILDVEIQKILYAAIRKSGSEFLVPPPADVVFTKTGHKIKTNVLTFAEVPENCGTDIRNRDWLVPTLDCSEKPAKDVPKQWYWDTFTQYMNGRLSEGSVFSLDDLGIASFITDTQIHNGLNPETRSTQEGRLFANKQLYMAAKNCSDGSLIPVELSFEVSEPLPTGDTYLGGERRTVDVRESKAEFPACPAIFDNQRFLKLVLLTHGSFGGWCPSWLQPDMNADGIEFVCIPGTEYKVRLRSACVSGWDGVSGWDYASKLRDGKKGKPKPLAKLVRPGSVYLLEIQNPAQSSDIAKLLWGNSICDGQSKKDGFGLVALGLASNQVKV